jgi:transposase-like protein
MTQRTRRKIDAALKAKIALETLPEQATVADLTQRHQVHPTRFTPGGSSFWIRRRERSRVAPAMARPIASASREAARQDSGS